MPFHLLLTGDCRTAFKGWGQFDMILADPPYGDTSLAWDKHCEGWIDTATDLVKKTGSLWVFGSMRFFLTFGVQFKTSGWKLAQDVVWEKHNGSSFHADRFKRVHEHVVQFYRADTKWRDVYNDVQKTADATARATRRKKRPAHTGNIGAGSYESQDGGPRIMRTVIYERSVHGRAIHPTEKPVTLLETLIRTSCPPGGRVADLFSGSGAVVEAAIKVGRDCVGCEIDPVMAAFARDRVAKALT